MGTGKMKTCVMGKFQLQLIAYFENILNSMKVLNVLTVIYLHTHFLLVYVYVYIYIYIETFMGKRQYTYPHCCCWMTGLEVLKLRSGTHSFNQPLLQNQCHLFRRTCSHSTFDFTCSYINKYHRLGGTLQTCLHTD
jgi:hypothetical protein